MNYKEERNYYNPGGFEKHLKATHPDELGRFNVKITRKYKGRK